MDTQSSALSDRLAAAKAAFRAGRHGETAHLCREALRAGDNVAEILTILGSLSVLVGRPQDGLVMLQLAVSLEPTVPALNSLGLALQAVRRFGEARQAFERAVVMDPAKTEVRRNLARCLSQGREYEKSRILYLRLFSEKEFQEKDWFLFFNVLMRLKRAPEAVQLMKVRLAEHPEDGEAWFGLGVALFETGEARQAAYAYDRCLEYLPGKVYAHINKASLLFRHGNPAAAAEEARKALEKRPNLPGGHMNLGLALASLGKTTDSLASFARTLELEPGNHKCRSNYLFYSHYLDNSNSRLFSLHREWNALHAAPLKRTIRPHANTPDPERKLKIGYVSPDFCFHSCFSFLQSLFEHHDRSRIHLVCYSGVERPDKATEWLRERADGWRDILHVEEDIVAQWVRDDGIDILVDLAGHTARHSQLVFARKPAPVQATWLGYPGTTGLDTIDWRISDRWLTPPDGSENFSEALWLMDRVSHCFTPEKDVELGPLPADARGHITFGSFNNFAKISDRTLRLWAQVLAAVPDARMMVKSRVIGADEAWNNLRDRFQAQGGDVARLTFTSGRAAKRDHLRIYDEVDVALDTTPYNGMTTSCESLYMGVPMITRIGDRTCSRYGLSVLAAVGLEQDFAARDDDDYVAKAVAAAADRDRLRALRATLRQRMLDSPLCDGPGFTRALEAAYRGMWARWCDTRRT